MGNATSTHQGREAPVRPVGVSDGKPVKKSVPEKAAVKTPDRGLGEKTVIRHITFWRDGFSVEDGELMRYDDPVNQRILEEINAGRAPPTLFNVRPGQGVEVVVARRLEESPLSDSQPCEGHTPEVEAATSTEPHTNSG